MVDGLDLFREHFASYADRYVLIGGTAASIAMDELGVEFRVTKDLDIILIGIMLGDADVAVYAAAAGLVRLKCM